MRVLHIHGERVENLSCLLETASVREAAWAEKQRDQVSIAFAVRTPS